MSVIEEINTKDDKAIKDDCHAFWNIVEKLTGFTVPTYIRNVLKFHGFDSAVNVKLMDGEDLNEIENFTKSRMRHMLPSDVNLKDFYGPFLESKDFQILRGHRKVLLEISALIRQERLQLIPEAAEFASNHTIISDEKEDNVFQTTRIIDSLKAGVNCSSNEIVHSTMTTSSEPTLTPTKIGDEPKKKKPSTGQDPTTLTAPMQTVNQERAKISVRRNCICIDSRDCRLSQKRPNPQEGYSEMSENLGSSSTELRDSKKIKIDCKRKLNAADEKQSFWKY